MKKVVTIVISLLIAAMFMLKAWVHEIDEYQTKEIDLYHRNGDDSANSISTLDEIQKVYYSDKNSTYDDLIYQYVKLRKDYECTQIDYDHKQFLLIQGM